jgi:hypothetical protein
MSQDIGFEVDELSLQGDVSIIHGADDPSIALVQKPIGSLYLRMNGETWQKVGSMANQWSKIQGSGSTQTIIYGNAEGGSAQEIFGMGLDGGVANSIYGGLAPLDGGSASGS